MNTGPRRPAETTDTSDECIDARELARLAADPVGRAADLRKVLDHLAACQRCRDTLSFYRHRGPSTVQASGIVEELTATIAGISETVRAHYDVSVAAVRAVSQVPMAAHPQVNGTSTELRLAPSQVPVVLRVLGAGSGVVAGVPVTLSDALTREVCFRQETDDTGCVMFGGPFGDYSIAVDGYEVHSVRRGA